MYQPILSRMLHLRKIHPMRKLTLLAAFLFAAIVHAQEKPGQAAWQAQKYSMFIHFGAIYSTLGGVWEGQPVKRGYSEQIQAYAVVFSDVYAAVAEQFKAPRWNADSIALLAKAAGMRSVVITSKHHDGFCMFHTATTDYNVVDATPFGRDVVKELADACKRHGLRFGLYFSLIDWHYPQASPISSSNSDPITPEHHAYNKAQITELLTHYGPISELWFDMGSNTPAQSRELADLVHRLQPECMVSGRLGNDAGDFCVMGDNDYPDYKIAAPWQTPASIYGETWGYRSWQEHGDAGEKAHEKLESLIKTVSRGGNYLLNIGPRGDGSVVEFEKEVLLRNGQWLERNGDAIYGANASPFETSFPWGEVTVKPGKLYLHLLQQPEGNFITLPRFNGSIKKITLLENHQPVGAKITKGKDGITIVLPAGFQVGNDIKVLELAMAGPYEVLPTHVASLPATLDRRNATPFYSFSGADYNATYRSTVAESWTLQVPAGKTLQPTVTYSAQEQGRSIDMIVDGQSQTITLDKGQPVPLPGNPSAVQWGPAVINGPYWCGLDDLPDMKEQAWQPFPGNAADSTNRFCTHPMDGWWVSRDITAPAAQDVLVGFRSGDGMQVFLNGTLQDVHNNPDRDTVQHSVLLLHLQPGKNKLLVKYWNRFHAYTRWSMDPDIPQQLYRQQLPAVTATGSGAYHMIKVQPHAPVSVHRDMRLPNIVLSMM
ncbi:alpha-L-fucosidase [Chitinophaga parva]|uniref:alpha-L-fucosidase n=2 Tax=Chitinophaga parva TaxID=2169414 RepID=A0A2T7BJ40_9BACT|nr:alpha-L-fucosidase [Chitinophaga parva]